MAVEADLPEEDRNLVWLDLPPFPKVQDLGLTIVNLGTAESPEFDYLSNVFPVDQWATMFRDRHWRGHVFAPAQYLARVTRVAKSILESEVPDIKIQPEAASWSKLEPPWQR
jgi:hypothetical protein